MRIRVIVQVALAILVLACLAAAPAFADGVYVRVTIDGSINPVTRDLIVRTIAEADARSAEFALIELNTPGGLESSMRDIIEAELSAPVPVVVYVSPPGGRAASAGTFIAMAADVAAMAPGTNIGAAHPVSLIGGTEPQAGDEPDPSAAKATNDAAAFARAIAERRGRNIDWAEQAVVSSSSISASEAVDLHVVDLVADDVEDLLARLDGWALPGGRTLSTSRLTAETVRPTLRERLLGYLADPNLLYVLFILGLYGLIYEFFHPGIGFGLAAGGICLLLALFGLQVLPVNVVGVVLTVFGMGLIVLDAFTPTNGILTAGGVVALFAGALTLFDIPDRSIGLSWGTIVAVIGTTAALSIFVLSKGLMAQRRRPRTGESDLVGAVGTVRRPLRPDGTVFVRGEYWSARSEGEPIGVGASVRVERIEGPVLIVRRIA